MTRVIRNQSGQYLKRSGEWSANFSEADIFPDTDSAIRIKNKFHLQSVELVLVMGASPSSQYDIVLPLS
jgi:hypothetical protein